MASCTSILTQRPKNIAVATSPAHDIKIIEADIPEPGPDDCLVHVRATGICGSDVRFWKHGNIGDSVITKDCGLGHESAGVVVKVGTNVTSKKVGKPYRILVNSDTKRHLQAIAWHWSAVYLVPSHRAMHVVRANTMLVQISSSTRPHLSMELFADTMCIQQPGSTRYRTT